MCNNSKSEAESPNHFLKTRDMVSEMPSVMTCVRSPDPTVDARTVSSDFHETAVVLGSPHAYIPCIINK